MIGNQVEDTRSQAYPSSIDTVSYTSSRGAETHLIRQQHRRCFIPVGFMAGGPTAGWSPASTTTTIAAAAAAVQTRLWKQHLGRLNHLIAGGDVQHCIIHCRGIVAQHCRPIVQRRLFRWVVVIVTFSVFLTRRPIAFRYRGPSLAVGEGLLEALCRQPSRENT